MLPAPRPLALSRLFAEGRRAAWLGLALALLTALAFAPVLDAGFVFDDRGDVLDNPAASPSGFAAALGRTNRPLLKATYALQRALTGEAARPFHAVNLALHLATALLVFALARSWARGARTSPPHPGEEERATLAGAGAAAIWALHPAAVEAVAPVTGRSVLLSTLLMLAALRLVTGRRAPGSWATWGAAALALAAPLARETALVLPALGLVWQLTLGAGEARRTALRRQLPLVAGVVVAALLLALSARQRELLAYSFATRGPLEALRGNLFAWGEIARLAIAPSRLSVDPGPAAALPWSAPGTLARLALVAGAAGGAFAIRRRRPLAAFAVLWIFVALLPANSIVWRLDPVSARPLYLALLAPALAVAASVAAGIDRLRRLPGSRARPLAAGAGLLAVVLVAVLGAVLLPRTHARAALYADPVALWSDAVAKTPERSRPWLNLGVELMLADHLDPAARAFERALALDPAASSARCALVAIRIRRHAAQLFERSPTS